MIYRFTVLPRWGVIKWVVVVIVRHYWCSIKVLADQYAINTALLPLSCSSGDRAYSCTGSTREEGKNLEWPYLSTFWSRHSEQPNR